MLVTQERWTETYREGGSQIETKTRLRKDPKKQIQTHQKVKDSKKTGKQRYRKNGEKQRPRNKEIKECQKFRKKPKETSSNQPGTGETCLLS
jgi:hypothetical protein